MKTKVFLITILTGLLSLTSCKSNEEKVISDLASLSERIEKHGNDFLAEDWEEALEDLADIHEDIDKMSTSEENSVINNDLENEIHNKIRRN